MIEGIPNWISIPALVICWLLGVIILGTLLGSGKPRSQIRPPPRKE